jgi:hypothetical protein
MSRCQHFKHIGDNYGISCQTCGEQLEGYGYGGFFGNNLIGNEHCIHVWLKTSAEKEECNYCHRVRDRVTN